MSCVDEIFLFQKKLNKYARLNEADKVLYYIHKLNHLNVTVSHLEETGVGKTVNALRHQGGKVGEKARGLVNKWKEMVTAEEEEEEEEDTAENEEEAQEGVETPTESRGGGEMEGMDDQEEEDGEENCLQIEENDNYMDEDDLNEPEDEPDDRPPPASSPANPYHNYDYCQRANSDSEAEEDGQYNPLTSQRDYQSNLGIPSTEYHPTSGILTPRDDSSPEMGLPSPEPAKDWRNGSSKKSSGSQAEKDHSQEREKRNKGKGRHKDRDRSGSRERDRKDKHRDKHRDREEKREEPEEERKSKSHKDKHHDREKRHHHHARSRDGKHRTDESGEKPKCDKDDRSLVNGYNASEHKDRGSRREKESERSAEDRQRERVGERVESTSQESGHKAERTKDSSKERPRESSKKDKQKKEHRDREESPRRHRKEKKSKHQQVAEEGSSSLVPSASESKETWAAERAEKGAKGKHKEEKRRHRDSSSSSSKNNSHKRDREEQENSSGDRSRKEKKSSTKQDAEMDFGFGAALMGLDSAVKKKKKKKKKTEDRESCSEDGQPSTSKGHKRGLSGDGGGLPDKKPKLLSTSKDRLPVLPSVMDEKPLLPEITPHYKPLPRVPVREEPPESSLSRMTEEEALNFVFQSKYNRRSKVYSGKVSGLTYVPSLYEICIRVLQENIDAMEYTGGVPFDILRPVLERASPKQLLNLEDYNPYLLEDSGVLWEVHCKRDFKKEKLEEMETWREMWLRCSEERDRKLRNLTHNLTEKFLTKAEPKRTTKIAYVDTPAKVPKGVARAQAKYGTAAASALAAKSGKANEVAARKVAMQNVQQAERAANPRPVAAKKKKVAPLMAKTRQFFKKTFRR